VSQRHLQTLVADSFCSIARAGGRQMASHQGARLRSRPKPRRTGRRAGGGVLILIRRRSGGHGGRGPTVKVSDFWHCGIAPGARGTRRVPASVMPWCEWLRILRQSSEGFPRDWQFRHQLRRRRRPAGRAVRLRNTMIAEDHALHDLALAHEPPVFAEMT
jgi:hypothetical protein